MNSSTKRRKEEFYYSYSLIRTIMHNYALSINLIRNKFYSWGITSGYYTILHVARLMSFISVKNFPKSHKKIRDVFTGKNRCFERKSILSSQDYGIKHYFRGDIISKLISLDQNISVEINNLGKELEILSKIRNNNSYDTFIISNQSNNKMLSPLFVELSDVILKRVKYWMKYSLRLFLKFISSLEEASDFLGVVTDNLDLEAIVKKGEPVRYSYWWGIPTFLKELEEQEIAQEVEQIKKIWDEIFKEEIKIQVNKVDIDFYKPMEYTNFSAKSHDFNNFERNISNYKEYLQEH